VNHLTEFVPRCERLIAQVFQDGGLEGHFTGGWQTPQLLVWGIQLSNFSKSNVERALNLRLMLETAIGIHGIRIGRDSGMITVEIPSPVRESLLARKFPPGTGLDIPMGLTVYNRPFSIDFEKTPHLMILGATGVGSKSVSLQTIVWSLARQNRIDRVAFVFIDLKGGQALLPFSGLAHSPFPVATKPEEAEKLLAWLLNLMRDRYEGNAGGPHIFLCIDEMLWLMRDVDNADEALGTLTSIARAANIHVIIASQEASKRSLGDTLVSRNIIFRLCGKVDTASSAFWATGVEKSGAEALIGRGDMIAYDGERLRRVQIARIFQADMEVFSEKSEAKRAFPDIPTSEKRPETRGGHNKIELQQEWIDAFQEGATVTEVMREFDLSTSVAYRAKEAVNGSN